MAIEYPIITTPHGKPRAIQMIGNHGKGYVDGARQELSRISGKDPGRVRLEHPPQDFAEFAKAQTSRVTPHAGTISKHP
jgi:hypothetical protein